MKILSIIYGNPSSYAILDNGNLESSKVFSSGENPFLQARSDTDIDNIKYFDTTFPHSNLISKNKKDYREIQKIAQKNEGQIYCLGNNQAIAANSYFSTNFDSSLIVTMMDEGEEQDGFKSSFSLWEGVKNNISPVHTFSSSEINVIRIWSNICQAIFGMPPSIESFSKIVDISKNGDSKKYKDKIWKMITKNHPTMSLSLSDENIRSYLDVFKRNDINTEEKTFIAAALQQCTIEMFLKILDSVNEISEIKNISLSGLSSFNNDLISSLRSRYPEISIQISDRNDIDEISIGAAKYIWHEILGNDRDTKDKKEIQ